MKRSKVRDGEEGKMPDSIERVDWYTVDGGEPTPYNALGVPLTVGVSRFYSNDLRYSSPGTYMMADLEWFQGSKKIEYMDSKVVTDMGLGGGLCWLAHSISLGAQCAAALPEPDPNDGMEWQWRLPVATRSRGYWRFWGEIGWKDIPPSTAAYTLQPSGRVVTEANRIVVVSLRLSDPVGKTKGVINKRYPWPDGWRAGFHIVFTLVYPWQGGGVLP